MCKRLCASFLAFIKCLLSSRMSVWTKPPISWLNCTYALQASRASHSCVLPGVSAWISLVLGFPIIRHLALPDLLSHLLFVELLYGFQIFITISCLFSFKGSCLLFILLVTYSWVEIQGMIKMNTYVQSVFFTQKSPDLFFKPGILKSLLSSKASHHLSLSFHSHSYLHTVYIISLWSFKQRFFFSVRRNGDISEKKNLRSPSHKKLLSLRIIFQDLSLGNTQIRNKKDWNRARKFRYTFMYGPKIAVENICKDPGIF